MRTIQRKMNIPTRVFTQSSASNFGSVIDCKHSDTNSKKNLKNSLNVFSLMIYIEMILGFGSVSVDGSMLCFS